MFEDLYAAHTLEAHCRRGCNSAVTWAAWEKNSLEAFDGCEGHKEVLYGTGSHICKCQKSANSVVFIFLFFLGEGGFAEIGRAHV